MAIDIAKDFYNQNFQPAKKADAAILTKLSRGVDLHFRLKYNRDGNIVYENINFPNSIIESLEWADIFEQGPIGNMKIVDGSGYFSSNLLFKLFSRDLSKLQAEFNFSYTKDVVINTTSGKPNIDNRLAFKQWIKAVFYRPPTITYDELGRLTLEVVFMPSLLQAELENEKTEIGVKKDDITEEDKKVKGSTRPLALDTQHSFREYIEKIYLSSFLADTSFTEKYKAKVSSFDTVIDNFFNISYLFGTGETIQKNQAIKLIDITAGDQTAVEKTKEIVNKQVKRQYYKEYIAGNHVRKNVISFTPDNTLTNLFLHLVSGESGTEKTQNATINTYDRIQALFDFLKTKGDNYNLLIRDFKKIKEKYEKGITLATDTRDSTTEKTVLAIDTKKSDDIARAKEILLIESIKNAWQSVDANKDTNPKNKISIDSYITPTAAGIKLDMGYLAQYFDGYKSAYYKTGKVAKLESKLFPLLANILVKEEKITDGDILKSTEDSIKNRYNFVDLKTFLYIILGYEEKSDKAGFENKSVFNAKSINSNRREYINFFRGKDGVDLSQTGLADINKKCSIKKDLETIDGAYQSKNIYISEFIILDSSNISLKKIKSCLDKINIISREYYFIEDVGTDKDVVKRYLENDYDNTNLQDNPFFFKGTSHDNHKNDYPNLITDKKNDIFSNETILKDCLAVLKDKDEKAVSDYLTKISDEVSNGKTPETMEGYLVKLDMSKNRSEWENIFKEVKDAKLDEKKSESKLTFLINYRHTDLMFQFNEWLALRRLFFLMGSYELGSNVGENISKNDTAKNLLFYKVPEPYDEKSNPHPGIFYVKPKVSDKINDFAAPINSVERLIKEKVISFEKVVKTSKKDQESQEITNFYYLNTGSFDQICKKLGFYYEYKEVKLSSSFDLNPQTGKWNTFEKTKRSIIIRNDYLNLNYDVTRLILDETVISEQATGKDLTGDDIAILMNKTILEAAKDYPLKVEIQIPGDPFYNKNDCDFFKELIKLEVFELEKVRFSEMFQGLNGVAPANMTIQKRGLNYVQSGIFTGLYHVFGAKHSFTRGSWTTTLKLMRAVNLKEFKSKEEMAVIEKSEPKVPPSKSTASSEESFPIIVNIYDIKKLAEGKVDNKLDLKMNDKIVNLSFKDIRDSLKDGKTLNGNKLDRNDSVIFLWELDVLKVLNCMGLEPDLFRDSSKVVKMYDDISEKDRNKLYTNLILFMRSCQDMINYLESQKTSSQEALIVKSSIVSEDTKKIVNDFNNFVLSNNFSSNNNESPFTYMLKVVFSKKLEDYLYGLADKSINPSNYKELLDYWWVDSKYLNINDILTFAEKSNRSRRQDNLKSEDIIKNIIFSDAFYEFDEIKDLGIHLSLLNKYNSHNVNYIKDFFDINNEKNKKLNNDFIGRYQAAIERGAHINSLDVVLEMIELNFYAVNSRLTEKLFKIDTHVIEKEFGKDKVNYCFVDIQISSEYHYGSAMNSRFYEKISTNKEANKILFS
jgi:hypothetical protein